MIFSSGRRFPFCTPLLVSASYLLLFLAVNCEDANCFPSNSAADTFVYSAKQKAEGRAEILCFTSIGYCQCTRNDDDVDVKGFLWQTFWFGGQSSTVLQESNTQKQAGHTRFHRRHASDCKHEHTKALTVCGAEVSETPSGLFPAWGTRIDPLKHICTVSDKQRKRERWKMFLTALPTLKEQSGFFKRGCIKMSHQSLRNSRKLSTYCWFEM